MAPRTRKSATSEGRMSFVEHLLEARKRLTRAALGIVVGAVAGFFLAPFVLDILRQPILDIAESRNASLNYDSISGAFDLRMLISIYLGVFISSPVWLYQIFAYITPALTLREKRYVFGFFFSAVPLFLVGCAAGFYVFPHIVELLASFASEDDTSIFLAKYYFDFAMKLVLVVGIGFVLPVFIVLLNFIGVWSAKGILQGWRWAILMITLFCAIATPAADVFSMFLLAIPMIVLYFVAVGIAFWHDRVASKRAEKLLADGLGGATT